MKTTDAAPAAPKPGTTGEPLTFELKPGPGGTTLQLVITVSAAHNLMLQRLVDAGMFDIVEECNRNGDTAKLRLAEQVCGLVGIEPYASELGKAPANHELPMVAFPATKTVHWPSGPVDACDEHARQLIGLGGIMAAHVVASAAAPGAECSNCKNEAKAKGGAA